MSRLRLARGRVYWTAEQSHHFHPVLESPYIQTNTTGCGGAQRFRFWSGIRLDTTRASDILSSGMWESFFNGLKTYESVAIWLEGIALILIFAWDRIDARQQHRETLAQLKVSQAQADAITNSERAWVMAELVPICEKFSDGYWRRRVGTGWATLSDTEILKGEYLKHALKFINMGRTPAHVLRYHIGYSREADVTENEIRTVDMVKRPTVEFDRLLGGNDSVEVTVVDVPQYINDSVVEIGDARATGILSGWVEYQHVFSDTDVVKIPFLYLYDPSTMRLGRIPLQKTEKGEKKQ